MRKNLLLGLLTLLTFGGLFCSNVALGQATLKHSYTFDDGTANDMVGSLNGTLEGTATVENGVLLLDADGDYMTLDGAALNMNAYTAITLEHFYTAPVGVNSGHWNWTSYFGGAGTQNIMTATNVWGEVRMKKNDSQQLQTAEKDDGEKHYVVSVMTGSSIKLYYDGVLVGENNSVGAIEIDPTYAYLGRAYWSDPSWQGSVDKFNIYDGELSASVIAKTAVDYLNLDVDLTDATLDTLITSVGTLEPGFTPDNDIYEVTVPYGTTSVTITAEPVVSGATVEIYDGLGNLTNGTVTFDKDEGIDVEVLVTALDGASTMSYYVSYFPTEGKSSATLSDITLSVGYLTTEFDMDKTSYIAIVPEGTTSVNVTGIPNWSKATVTGGGTVALTDGKGSATLTVTSEDGTETMDYMVDISATVVATNTDFYLVHEANGFVATESGAAFNQVVLAEAVVDSAAQIWHFEETGETGKYYIRNKAGHYIWLSGKQGNVYDVEVYPGLPTTALDSAYFSLNEFEPGRFKIISVKRQQASATANMLSPNNGQLGSALYSDKSTGSVWDAPGYTVWNIKLASDKSVASPYDVHLSDLALNGIPVTPVFDPAYRTYYATIPDNVNSVEVTATPMDATATVTGTGTVDVSDGKGMITVTVTASDPQYTREYVIKYTKVTLMHSYTFDDGTADDMVGNVNGVLVGDAISIADGKATVSGAVASSDGYISLNGTNLALSKYTELTIEAMIEAGNQENLGVYTMLTYFGTSTAGSGCLWMQPTRAGDESRVETNNGNTTKTALLSGVELDDGLKHHVAVVLNNTYIRYYLDGEVVSETATGGDYIKTIGTYAAYMFKGVWSDPNYNASIYEYNIFEGEMSEDSILERANKFLGGLSRDATLASLSVDKGTMLPEFNSDVVAYTVVVPFGTATVTVTAVPNDGNATVEGAGAVDVSSGSARDTILVTAEDGLRTKMYYIEFSNPTEATLMHSYTFDDGTAADVVGTADGMLMGAGMIANGAYTAAANGDFIELPAADIAINMYSAITLEANIFADVDNTGATMMAYFGGNENALGGNGLYITPDRWTESRTAISCGNLTAPWSAEQGVTGSPVSVGEKHHVVTVLTNTSIKLYIDGELIGEAVVSGDNSIAGISNANAWLCKGGYDADPTWMGTIDEFNIYEGVMDAATVAERAKQYLGGGEALTLMHSYTFDDGTAADVVGGADGALEGDAAVADGMLTLSGTGFVTLPAADINVASYGTVTIEGVIKQAEGLDGFTAFASFGDVNSAADWMGINYIILQPTRNDGDNSRTSISCLNTTDPWASENGVMGDEIKDTETHHWVTVVTESEIKLYIDGVLIGSDPLTGNNSLANVGTSVALIGKDVYPGDPLWQGSIDELNIYQGEMDAATVAQRAMKFLSGLTLMHSYTFEDGTADDMVGTADGVLEGDAAVADGMLTLSGTGFVTLPAADIDIASYGTVTIEGVIKQAEGLDGFTAFASFGDVNSAADWMGINYIILQPTRNDGDNSRTSISCLNTTDPWASENGVMGDEIKDTKTHHWVTVVTETEIKLYIDGVLIGMDALTGNNSLANVGTSVALIGKDVYPGDPLWQGSVEELNIYQGEMDAATIAQRANDFTTGIPNISDNDASIKVYPTYSTGLFNVETSGSRGKISVYNLLGKLVTQKMIESSHETIMVSDMGMYIMKVECDNASQTFKVFKTK